LRHSTFFREFINTLLLVGRRIKCRVRCCQLLKKLKAADAAFSKLPKVKNITLRKCKNFDDELGNRWVSFKSHSRSWHATVGDFVPKSGTLSRGGGILFTRRVGRLDGIFPTGSTRRKARNGAESGT
jgi:hypothetical protein